MTAGTLFRTRDGSSALVRHATALLTWHRLALAGIPLIALALNCYQLALAVAPISVAAFLLSAQLNFALPGLAGERPQDGAGGSPRRLAPEARRVLIAAFPGNSQGILMLLTYAGNRGPTRP